MSEIKSCPSCNRSYSDSSLSFCLEDGSLLSASHELKANDKDEEATLVRSSGNSDVDLDESKRRLRFIENRESIAQKFKKTQRTEDELPILNSEPTYKGRDNRWSAADEIRKITYEITGVHTYHAQENVVILREFFNEFKIKDENKLLEDSTMCLGEANFYTAKRKKRFSYNFQPRNNPTKEKFLKELDNFLNW
jgi:hypothetical protein